MKIVIHARVLNGRRGGPWRFTLNLIRALADEDKVNKYYLLLDKDYKFSFVLPGNFNKVILPTKSRFIFDYYKVPLFSYKHEIDFFIFPKNTYPPYIRGKKLPVFHDLIYFEKGFRREFRFFDNLHHRTMIPVSARLSHVNLCVSPFTEKKVESLLKIKGKNVVVGEGVEPIFSEEGKDDPDKRVKFMKKFGIKNKYIFYCGSFSPRKNVVRILQSFKKAQKEIDHDLFLISSYSWNDQETLQELSQSDKKRVFLVKGVGDDDLVNFYRYADLFLYPSLYEGFGLPILEAQACGCPVLTSNISACPETAGSGAHFVDPYKVAAITEGILKVVGDRHYRDDLVEKGNCNIERFSWAQTAQIILQIMTH